MIIKIFLFWRIGLFFIGYLGSLALPKIANGGLGSISTHFNYWTSWAQWDGGHYFDIVSRGYLQISDYAFFPLYPTLVKSADFLLGNIILSGLLVSNLAFLFFLFVLFKYATEKYNKKIALNILTSYLVFPTTFFAVAFYSESLFLLLSVLFFYMLNRRNFLTAAIVVSLASLTRPVGITLAIALFYSYFTQIKFNIRKIDKRVLYLLPSLFGFAVYSIYLWSKTNDPLRFLSVQSIWNRSVSDPISTIFSYFWAYLVRETRPVNDYFDLVVALIFLAILIIGRRKIPSSLWIFSVLVILIPASSQTLTSMPRYALSSLGAFTIVSKYLEEKPALKIPLWASMLTLQAFLLVRFINGYWVA